MIGWAGWLPKDPAPPKPLPDVSLAPDFGVDTNVTA
jgi:hypothetical protein